MKVLVTGAAGFIGSHLVGRLLDDGHEVTALDDLYEGSLDNLGFAKGSKNFRFVEADVRDKETLDKELEGVENVFHLAARNLMRSLDSPETDCEVNALGTVRILQASLEKGVRRFVHVSSASVYGEPNKFPTTEDQPTVPTCPYGVSKLCGENYARVFHSNFGLDTVVLRYFNVYGTRQSPNSYYTGVIPIFIKSAMAGKPLTVYGDGEQVRDFTNVCDTVDATIRASKEKKCVGNVYNVCTGSGTTVNQLAELIRGETASDSKIEKLPDRKAEIRKRIGDNSRLREDAGFVPGVSLKSGLSELVKFYTDNPAELERLTKK